jgi:hypothetical protein
MPNSVAGRGYDEMHLSPTVRLFAQPLEAIDLTEDGLPDCAAITERRQQGGFPPFRRGNFGGIQVCASIVTTPNVTQLEIVSIHPERGTPFAMSVITPISRSFVDSFFDITYDIEILRRP